MKKAELKTKANAGSVSAFLKKVDPDRRADCEALIAMMKKATGADPVMWGTSIIGFGDYEYLSPKTGRGGDWFQVGFSPRKTELALYLVSDLQPLAATLKKLGPHKAGKGCLYVKRLTDVDTKVLQGMVVDAVKAKNKS